MKQLTEYMPPDVYAWDDAGNNRWIISGSGPRIRDPAVRLGGRGAHSRSWRAALASRHASQPSRPLPWQPAVSLGVWIFARNIPAAKDLLMYMSPEEQSTGW